MPVPASEWLKVAGRTHYILRGRIEDVPTGITARVVTQTIDAAGQTPNEAGIAWANHTVRTADRAPEIDPRPDPWAWSWEHPLSQPAPTQCYDS